jgi:hypothetical protein
MTFAFEYFSEVDFTFENLLGCESGAPCEVNSWSKISCKCTTCAKNCIYHNHRKPGTIMVRTYQTQNKTTLSLC